MDAVLTKQMTTSDAEAIKEKERQARVIHENYKKLLEGRGSDQNGVSVAPAPARAASPEPIQAPVASYGVKEAPAAEESVYEEYRYKPNSARRMLFENVTYHNGNLEGHSAFSPVMTATVEAPVDAVAEVPVEAPAYENPSAPEMRPQESAATAPAIDTEIESEDARPTPRTMETLNKTASILLHQREEEEQVGLFASLGKRTKLILAAVTFVLMLVIAVICINTSLLNSLEADITTLGEEAAELETRASQIVENIKEITSEEYIAEWASENGMVR